MGGQDVEGEGILVFSQGRGIFGNFSRVDECFGNYKEVGAFGKNQ